MALLHVGRLAVFLVMLVNPRAVQAQGPRTVLFGGLGGLLPARAIGTYGVASGHLSPAIAFQVGLGIAGSSDRHGVDVAVLLAPGTGLDVRPTASCVSLYCGPLSNPAVRLSVVSAIGWIRPSPRFRLQAGLAVVVRHVSAYDCICEPFDDRYFIDAARFRERHTAVGLTMGAWWAPDSRKPYELGVEDIVAPMETGRIQHYLTVVARVRWRSSGQPG